LSTQENFAGLKIEKISRRRMMERINKEAFIEEVDNIQKSYLGKFLRL
jgi:hypothetical protein